MLLQIFCNILVYLFCFFVVDKGYFFSICMNKNYYEYGNIEKEERMGKSDMYVE